MKLEAGKAGVVEGGLAIIAVIIAIAALLAVSGAALANHLPDDDPMRQWQREQNRQMEREEDIRRENRREEQRRNERGRCDGSLFDRERCDGGGGLFDRRR
jgi:hypothetical protein